ncbi:MAG: hypothetical protein HY221_00760 [Candidatus Sungbacteria bacterium]|uniref:Uncharacterized protein n=1 Tax=Candidatus Sungiibacteriota bacterium TaxID=2750080 RepID=A0A932VR26_9BACT|nr:hypothetical protein [Candidatus Sungbacteria bacterium]
MSRAKPDNNEMSFGMSDMYGVEVGEEDEDSIAAGDEDATVSADPVSAARRGETGDRRRVQRMRETSPVCGFFPFMSLRSFIVNVR